MRFKLRFPHIAGFLLGLAISVSMFGCSKQSTGKSLGTAWVIHNSATQTMIGLGEAEVVDVDVLKEFDSYQDPVLDGLNAATEDYLDGDEDVDEAKMILSFIGPMLERMIELTEGEDDD